MRTIARTAALSIHDAVSCVVSWLASIVRPMSLQRMACSFTVVDDLKGGEPYDTVEYSRAFFALFEGAIYLHQVEAIVAGISIPNDVMGFLF